MESKKFLFGSGEDLWIAWVAFHDEGSINMLSHQWQPLFIHSFWSFKKKPVTRFGNKNNSCAAVAN